MRRNSSRQERLAETENIPSPISGTVQRRDQATDVENIRQRLRILHNSILIERNYQDFRVGWSTTKNAQNSLFSRSCWFGRFRTRIRIL